VAYLAELQELFHGDLRLMMAAYAAGEGPVQVGEIETFQPFCQPVCEIALGEFGFESQRLDPTAECSFPFH
jgi:hypothetical protein